MDYQQELQLAEAAWDATKRDDQPPFGSCAQTWKESLLAKVKSVERHGPAEGDAFEQQVAEYLASADKSEQPEAPSVEFGPPQDQPPNPNDA